jgi:hypothetical protein
MPASSGVGKLSPMTWPWLVGTPVVLFVFIAAVMGFLPSVGANVQLVRRLMSRRAKKPAFQPTPTVPIEASPSTGGASPADVPHRSVTSYMAASSPLHTITFGSGRESYIDGVSQPTPWDGRAKRGVVVYPGGL